MSEGGLHIHHAVPGIILLVVGVLMSVGTGSVSPFAEIAAARGHRDVARAGRVRAILHLEDVLGAGRPRSVEMVTLAIGATGLALVGVNPFDFSGDAGDTTKIALGSWPRLPLRVRRRVLAQGEVPDGAVRDLHPVRVVDRRRAPRPADLPLGQALLPSGQAGQGDSESSAARRPLGPHHGTDRRPGGWQAVGTEPAAGAAPVEAVVSTSALDADYAAAWAEWTSVNGIGPVPSV